MNINKYGQQIVATKHNPTNGKTYEIVLDTIDNTPTFFIHKKSARSTDYDHAFTLELATAKAEFWLTHVRVGWGWKSTPMPEGNDQ